jgi:hypothetical protein
MQVAREHWDEHWRRDGTDEDRLACLGRIGGLCDLMYDELLSKRVPFRKLFDP